MRKRKSFIRTGHGKGAGAPHIEVSPPDELSSPLPAHVPDLAELVRRRDDGKIADSTSAKIIGRLGGLAKARRVKLIDSLGLANIAEGSAFEPYHRAATEFTAHHIAELTKLAGGRVGSGPSTMVASAALQLAASRFAFDKAATTGDVGLMKLGSSLATDSRQNLLAAYELSVREAEARTRTGGDEDDPLFAKDGE